MRGMKEIDLKILGKPIAKQRPRFVNRASKKAYNPQKTEEDRWIWEARMQISPEIKYLPLTGPILVRIVFLMAITKDFSKSKIQMIKNGVWIPYVKKAHDIDNLQKWVLDCCNGWLWKDDSQVYQIEVTKRYGIEAATKIQIIEIGD